MTDISGDCPRCGQCEGYGCSCTTEEQQSAHIDQLLARIDQLEAEKRDDVRAAVLAEREACAVEVGYHAQYYRKCEAASVNESQRYIDERMASASESAATAIRARTSKGGPAMSEAPKTISVDFNGNGTASVISDVPVILGTAGYTLTSSVAAQLKAADELAERAGAVFRSEYHNTNHIEGAKAYFDANMAALTAYRATKEIPE